MALTPIICNKKSIEEREEKLLGGYAVLSRNISRLHSIPSTNTSDFRSEFQHDRDRIIHSRAFRRLKQKTQVFMPDDGDHFRTRLSHTLEVSQLSRTLARSLGLNEDLVEAITLAHDMGHSPFGHSGEEALHKIMSGKDSLGGELNNKNTKGIIWGGFKHNHQSLRIVDLLENKYSTPGLNLTNYVREGILRHTKVNAKTGVKEIRYNDLDYSALHLDKPQFIEGQIVALIDEIAQHTHDIEDGFRASVIDIGEVKENVSLSRSIIAKLEKTGLYKNEYLIRNSLVHDMIGYLIRDVRTQSYKNIKKFLSRLGNKEYNRDLLPDNIISFSKEGRKLFDELATFVITRVIRCQEVDRRDARAAVIIPQLFKAYLKNPRLLPDYLLKRIGDKNTPFLRHLSAQEIDGFVKKNSNNIRYLRSICDHIAGMTDSFAIKEFQMMVNPA